MRKASRTSLAAFAITATAYALAVLSLSPRAVAQSAPNKSEYPARSQWKTSPFHGVIGGDGKVIPCRCLFRGTSYGLGEKVCMSTPQGTVMTECDLQQNNTSWVPTSEPCTIS